MHHHFQTSTRPTLGPWSRCLPPLSSYYRAQHRRDFRVCLCPATAFAESDVPPVRGCTLDRQQTPCILLRTGRPTVAHPQLISGRGFGRPHAGLAFRLRRSCLDLRHGLYIRSDALEPAESLDRALRNVAIHRQPAFECQLKGLLVGYRRSLTSFLDQQGECATRRKRGLQSFAPPVVAFPSRTSPIHGLRTCPLSRTGRHASRRRRP